jgi:hypothetical protein
MAAREIMQKTPSALLAVAVALFFATAMSCLTGISLLYPNPALNRVWELNRPAYVAFAPWGKLVGALLLALGVFCAAAALGLLQRKRWAWWAAVILFSINGLGDLLTVLSGRDVGKGGAGVLVASLFLFCLIIPATRGHFDVRDAGY